MDKYTFLRNYRAMTEANAAFFVKKVDDKRRARGKELQHYFVGVDRDSSGNAVIEFAVPSQSDPGKRYSCFIDVIPKETSLFNLSKVSKRLDEKVRILKEADVKCFCSCPDFNWSGMKYNMKHVHDSMSEGHHADDAKDDNGEDIDPKVRDPKHRNTLCKHLVAALRGVLTNAPSIMKRVRETPAEEPAEDHETAVKEPEKPVEHDTALKEPETPAEHDTAGTPEETTVEHDVADSPEELVGHGGASDDVKHEAIESFGETAPVKTEETQQALDALAENIEPGQGSESAEHDPGAGLVGHGRDEKPISHVYAYEDMEPWTRVDMPLDHQVAPQS